MGLIKSIPDISTKTPTKPTPKITKHLEQTWVFFGSNGMGIGVFGGYEFVFFLLDDVKTSSVEAKGLTFKYSC